MRVRWRGARIGDCEVMCVYRVERRGVALSVSGESQFECGDRDKQPSKQPKHPTLHSHCNITGNISNFVNFGKFVESVEIFK